MIDLPRMTAKEAAMPDMTDVHGLKVDTALKAFIELFGKPRNTTIPPARARMQRK